MAFLFLFIISCSARLRLRIWRRSFSAFGPEHVLVRVLTGRKGSRGQKTRAHGFLQSPDFLFARFVAGVPAFSAGPFPLRQRLSQQAGLPGRSDGEGQAELPEWGPLRLFCRRPIQCDCNNLGLFVPKALLPAKLTLLRLTGLGPQCGFMT